MGENTDTTEINIKAVLDASKVVGVEVSSKETKYIFMSHYPKAG
jgi:hypothetical protein